MGRASPILLVLLALGFFFGTYNLLTITMQHKASNSGSWIDDGLDLIDSAIRMPGEANQRGNPNLKYHVVVTATDAPYSQWQCRIMYYWYKKMKDSPGSDMGKFTRVLHSGHSDTLMKEIPTFVVDPLPQGLDRVRTLVLLLDFPYHFFLKLSSLCALCGYPNICIWF